MLLFVVVLYVRIIVWIFIIGIRKMEIVIKLEMFVIIVLMFLIVIKRIWMGMGLEMFVMLIWMEMVG